MRSLRLSLLAASLLLAIGAAHAATTNTVIPASAVQTATQLRDKAMADVDFGSSGLKRLALRYAPLEKL